MPSHLHRSAILGFGLAAISFLVAGPSLLRADDDQPQAHDEQASLSDAVGDGLAKLEPLIKDKDYDGAMRLVQGLLKDATPESYDQAFLNETAAQILTQKGDYLSAIKPLETALNVADRHHYFQAKQELDMLYFISQLYYQQADAEKNDRQAQVESFGKAIHYIERWFKVSPKPTEDISMYYAQILYAAAVAKDPAHPDAALIHQARRQVEKTLTMTPHPKDGVYVFLLATLQQEVDYKAAAEILELLLAKNPNNKTYWQDLNMFYMALAQDPKDKNMDTVRKYNIRAIDTIERAQNLGFMKTPRDNYTLFTLYYNIAQYGMAADILYNGLQTGGIDPTLDNWLLLSASYQQINQDFKSIEVLEEAAKRFPTNGELEFKIAQVYQGLDDNQKAYEHCMAAVEKGHIVKPQPAYIFLAYMAYELAKYDEAKVAIDKAISLMSKPDHQALGLKAAIEEAVKERDAKKAEKAAAAAAAPAQDKL